MPEQSIPFAFQSYTEPRDPEVELALCALQETRSEADLAELVSLAPSSAFTQAQPRKLWIALEKLSASDWTYTPDAQPALTVFGHVKPEEIEGVRDWLAQNLDPQRPPVRAYRFHLADLVRARRTWASFGTALRDWTAEIASQQSDPAQLDLAVTECLLDLEKTRDSAEAGRVHARNLATRLEAGEANHEAQYVQTGLLDFDQAFGGLERGAFVVLGARTSVGKSTLALQVALNVAREGGHVLFASCEMTGSQVLRRCLANLAGIPANLMRERDRLDAQEGARLNAAHETLTEELGQRLHLYCPEDGAFSLNSLRKLFLDTQRKTPLDLFVVDYVQKVRVKLERRNSNRLDEVAEVSSQLQAMGLREGVPIIAPAQLNRMADASEKPRLSHLRECGDLEQDAHMVWLLSMDGESLLFDVAKNRGEGGTKELRLDFDKPCFRITDAAPKAVSASLTSYTGSL